MIAIEVVLNNKKISTAGAEDLCVLSAIMSAGGKLGRESHGTRDEKNEFDLSLWVGGLTARGEGTDDDHLNWIERRPISLGDTVTLKFVESSRSDDAVNAKTAGGNTKEMNEQRMFEMAKETYLKLKDKFE